MARIESKQIDGLTFAIDRKTVDKHVIVEGKNFLLDLDGARSSFAHIKMAKQTEFDSLPESFIVGLEVFQVLKSTKTNTMGIFQLNWVEKQWELILSKAVDPNYITYKTTYAQVGGRQYFAGRGWGVFQRDVLNLNDWSDVTASFPSNTFYITESSGRCIALAEGIVAWSTIDNAVDFVPDVNTGAGFQSLSLIGKPEIDFDYKGIQRTADGFIVFMQQGIMKSTSIDNVVQFRHRVIDRELKVLNGWCFVTLNTNEIIFLTNQGLYSTKGTDNVLTLWQPLVSEFLKLNIIPTLTANVNGQIQLHYSKEKDWFFISYTQSVASGVFERSIVSYIPRGEWGSFNELHRGFIDIDVTGSGSLLQRDQLGFMSVNSEIALFDDAINHTEMVAFADVSPASLLNEIVYLDKVYDIPTVVLEGVHVVNTRERDSGNNIIHIKMLKELIPIPEIPGFYEAKGVQQIALSSDTLIPAYKLSDSINNIVNAQEIEIRDEVIVYGFTKQPNLSVSLDSNVTIGLFRLTDEQESDQISQITNVAISMTGNEVTSSIIEDWLNDFNPDLIVDWLNDFPVDVVEDWGINVGSSSNYIAHIYGSLDGYKQFSNNQTLLDLALEDGKTRFYSTDLLGLYVLIVIKADQINDYIHLKHVELTGNLSGRL